MESAEPGEENRRHYNPMVCVICNLIITINSFGFEYPVLGKHGQSGYLPQSQSHELQGALLPP